MQALLWIARSYSRRAALFAALLTGAAPAIAADTSGPSASPSEAAAALKDGCFSLGLLGGVSYGNELGVSGPRLLFGYGGRVGYRFAATSLFLGFTVIHRRDELNADPGEEVGTEHRIATELEAGAELPAGFAMIRPYIGLGTLLSIFERGADSGSAISPLVVPGVLVHRSLGIVDLGLDLRWEAASGAGSAASVMASAGVAL